MNRGVVLERNFGSGFSGTCVLVVESTARLSNSIFITAASGGPALNASSAIGGNQFWP
jgi:hypothetical protein